MEKLANWYAIAKMWEKHLEKKEVLIKGPASQLKISLWDSFQFLPVQKDLKRFKKINGLLQTSPSTITWYIAPFKGTLMQIWKSANMFVFI